MNHSWTKTHFETWITRNDLNGVSLFHLSYLITHLIYLCSQMDPVAQINSFKFHWSIYRLFVLNRGWTRVSLQKDIRKYLLDIRLDMRHVRTKNAFWYLNNKKWCKWCLFHISYLIPLLAYLCSQMTPNVQIKYFMFDWSIYSLFVLNRGWKCDSPNKNIRIYLIDTRHRRNKISFWYVYNMK
jgi:hypothetical protein